MSPRLDRSTRGVVTGAAAVLAGSLLACSVIVGGDLTGGTLATNVGGVDSGDADSATADLDAANANGSYVETVLADHPIAYWRLGEATGASSAKSEVGSIACSLNGPMTWSAPGATANDANTALQLDGEGTLDCGNRFDFTGVQPFTLEAWLRVDTLDQVYRFAFAKRDEGAAGGIAAYALVLHAPEGISFQRQIANVDHGVTMPFTIPLTMPTTAFRHVVGVYTGAELQLFSDGDLVATTPDDRSAPSIDAPFRIGSFQLGTSYGFVGTLDELAIYDKAVSAERIHAHYLAARR